MSDLERHFESIIREEVTRRRLLRRGAAGALSVSALSYLAACGSETGPGAGDNEPESKVIKKGEIGDSLYVANWPLYIDEKRESLKKFQDKYGAKVKYVEEINDNTEFFGKVRQQYDRGDSGGRDIHVVTDWMAGKMITLGYVQKLDHAALPNVTANLIDRLKSPPFDPKRDYSVPWQSGFAGIIYRKDKVKREPKSIDDLFDPAYKGKVTMLTEMRDTVGLVAASMGADPETATKDEFMKAIDKIGEASDSGQIRGFTGNEYTKDITKGDSWVIIGWSGDAVQLEADNPNIKFIAARERRAPVDRQHGDAGRRARGVRGREVHGLRLRAGDPGGHRRVRELHLPGERREGDPRGAGSVARGEPADLPGRQDARRGVHLPPAEGRRGQRADRGVPARDRRVGRTLCAQR